MKFIERELEENREGSQLLSNLETIEARSLALAIVGLVTDLEEPAGARPLMNIARYLYEYAVVNGVKVREGESISAVVVDLLADGDGRIEYLVDDLLRNDISVLANYLTSGGSLLGTHEFLKEIAARSEEAASTLVFNVSLVRSHDLPRSTRFGLMYASGQIYGRLAGPIGEITHDDRYMSNESWAHWENFVANVSSLITGSDPVLQVDSMLFAEALYQASYELVHGENHLLAGQSLSGDTKQLASELIKMMKEETIELEEDYRDPPLDESFEPRPAEEVMLEFSLQIWCDVFGYLTPEKSLSIHPVIDRMRPLIVATVSAAKMGAAMAKKAKEPAVSNVLDMAATEQHLTGPSANRFTQILTP